MIIAVASLRRSEDYYIQGVWFSKWEKEQEEGEVIIGMVEYLLHCIVNNDIRLYLSNTHFHGFVTQTVIRL
jgi:hypothetical protein